MSPDLILLDIGLPGGNGIDLLGRLRNMVPQAPIIMVSARDPAVWAEKALAGGAVGFLQKPVDDNRLLAAIKTALETVGMGEQGA